MSEEQKDANSKSVLMPPFQACSSHSQLWIWKLPGKCSFHISHPLIMGVGMCVFVTANTHQEPIFVGWEKPAELIFWKPSCDVNRTLTLFFFTHILLGASKWGSCCCNFARLASHPLQPATSSDQLTGSNEHTMPQEQIEDSSSEGFSKIPLQPLVYLLN